MKKVEELRKNYYQDLGDYGEYIADYNNGYICDIFSYIADDVDIYYSDLIEWLKEGYNEQYVEQAVNEGLTDTSNFDLFKAIQSGQYLQRNDDLYEHEEAIIKFRLFEYILRDLKIEEITDEQADEIENMIVDSNDRLEDLFEAVDEILEQVVITDENGNVDNVIA